MLLTNINYWEHFSYSSLNGFFVLCTQWVLHFVAYLCHLIQTILKSLKRETQKINNSQQTELSRTSALICLSALMEWSVLLLLLLLSSPLSSLNVNNNKHTTSVLASLPLKEDSHWPMSDSNKTNTHSHTYTHSNAWTNSQVWKDSLPSWNQNTPCRGGLLFDLTSAY